MEFEAKAYRRDTGVVTLLINATASNSAEAELRSQGYRVIALSERAGPLLRFGRKDHFRASFPLLVFCQELAALTGAGLSLIEAIEALLNRSTSPSVSKVLDQLRTSLREGNSLSAAMSAMPQAFPELFIATIRSSEETGELTKALRRYIAYRQTIDGLRDKIIAASVYPALLLAVGGLVVIFLLGYVVPRFSRVFEGLGGDLPYLSRLLMGWGQFASQHIVALGVSFLAGLLLCAYVVSRPESRAWIIEKAWRLPVVGERLRVYQLASMTRTLAMLLSGGIPLVAALGMTRDLLRQPALARALEDATRSIREGGSLTTAFTQFGLATDVGLKMLAVGERSGELSRMLDELADFYDLDNERFISWSTRLIEPLFMIAIGVVVGVIVLLMYFPIFELAGNLR